MSLPSRDNRRSTGQVRQTEHIDCGNLPGHRDSHCTFACNVQCKNTPVVRLELPVAILTSYLAGELVHNFAAKVLIKMQAQTQLTADKGCQLKPHCHCVHASTNPWQLTTSRECLLGNYKRLYGRWGLYIGFAT